MYCIVLHCNILYCTKCIELHCTVYYMLLHLNQIHDSLINPIITLYIYDWRGTILYLYHIFWYGNILYFTVWRTFQFYWMVIYCIGLYNTYCILLYSIILSTELYCIIWYFLVNILYGIILYYTMLNYTL